MSGRFVVKKRPKGTYYFVLKSGNGAPVIESGDYKQKSSAIKGIDAVRKCGNYRIEDEAA